MNRTNRKRLAASLAVAVWLATAGPALACWVPVFRYALERWPIEPYQVYVFHRGPLRPEEQATVDWLAGAARAGPRDPCLMLHLVNLDADPPGAAMALWRSQASAKPPWLVVRYPPSLGIPADVWAGPLGPSSARTIVDSPARREIARRVLGGDSIVFLLLESGNAARDDAAHRTLTRDLARLQSTLTLPEPVDGLWNDPVYDERGAPDLRIAFSVLRVARDDPAERPFVNMLLASEADLRDFDEPVVFPVYGRGRALYALVGKGINAENLRDACEFLTGPCSCIVKGQNPGADLLIVADWDTALAEEGSAIPPVVPPPLQGLAEFAVPDAVPEGPSDGPPGWALVHNALLAAGAGLVILVVAGLYLMRKARRERH